LLIDFMIVRRLDLLSAAMEKFPEQEIDKEDLPGGHDEIGELSDNFSKLGNRFLLSQSELEKTREQMYQQEKMAAIGQLAAGIAHEVNNPLSGMQNCVKSIREAPEDTELRARYLDLVDKGLQRIGHTVRQLLNSGRKEPLRRRSANVDEILQECLELLDYQLKGIELKLDLNIKSLQLVDAEAMKQAFVNIVLNAAQAMSDGGSLTVSSRENKSSFRVQFADTGNGITPEQQEHIFEPFYTTKDTGEGTGLGLSVSFSLIKRMNGNISVDSKPNEGATFTIEVSKPE
jgi:two-component system NtrC family sensor kinase